MNKPKDLAFRKTQAQVLFLLVTTLALNLLSKPLHAFELIGPYDIFAAPISAQIISGGDPDNWLNTVNQPTDYNAAFSGPGIIDDGYANLGPLSNSQTTIEVQFAPATVVNSAGSDLVFFDAQFSANSYEIATEFDSFLAWLPLPSTSFVYTGLDRNYYFGGNLGGSPFTASVMAAEIDLSNLGLPLDQSVTRIRFRTISDQADPLGIGSLTPEPATITLGLIGILSIIQKRPRNRRIHNAPNSLVERS